MSCRAAPRLRSRSPYRRQSLTAEPGGAALTELSFGTVLASIEHADGYTRVATPDDGSGWLADDVLRSVEDPRLRRTGSGWGRCSSASNTCGVGRPAYGLDCSGLIHTVGRVLGLRTPRDAHDQAAALENIPVDEARPGDLYFFGRPGQQVHHVGFVSAEGMLHASETGKRLENAAPDRRPPSHVGHRRTLLTATFGGAVVHNALDPRDLVPDEAEQLVSAGYPAADLLERARQAAADDDLTALATVETELAALERPADWPYDEPPAAPVELPPAPVDEDTLADRISGAWLGRCIGNTMGKPVEGLSRADVQTYLRAADAWPLTGFVPYLETPPEGTPAAPVSR